MQIQEYFQHEAIIAETFILANHSLKINRLSPARWSLFLDRSKIFNLNICACTYCTAVKGVLLQQSLKNNGDRIFLDFVNFDASTENITL
jgi:hypothetical protein